MKSTKHILWLCPGFAADEHDDACIPPLQLFLNELTHKFPDYKISIIALQYPYKNDVYKIGNTSVFPMNGGNRKGIGRLFFWKKVADVFRKIHRDDPVTLIHSFWFSECMLVGKYLSSKYKIPHINTLMGQDVLTSNRYLKKYFFNSVPAIALCERHAAIYKENTGEDSYAIIPWGIDNMEIKWNAEKEFDIIAVGSLIPLKRYDVLLDVLATLKKSVPAIKVLLVGDGPERKSLERRSQKLNLSDNIVFAGNQSRAEVMNLMSKSRIFVHTSVYESFGFVFLEAMKSGLPIVSFAVGIAESSDRWMVVHSQDEMVEALKTMVSGGKNVNPMIPFSVEDTALKYAGIYARLEAAAQ